MNLDRLEQVWNDFLAFLDRTFQWLMYLFTGEGDWPPVDFPDFNEPSKDA